MTSETLAAAIGRIQTFTGDSPFATWITRIGAAVAYGKLRAGEERGGDIALIDVLPPLDVDGHFEMMDDWSGRAGDAAEEGEIRQILSATMGALPADYRTAFVLHDIEGMRSADIAEALGIEPRGVDSRVHGARLFLRRHLAEHFDADPASVTAEPRDRQ